MSGTDDKPSKTEYAALPDDSGRDRDTLSPSEASYPGEGTTHVEKPSPKREPSELTRQSGLERLVSWLREKFHKYRNL